MIGWLPTSIDSIYTFRLNDKSVVNVPKYCTDNLDLVDIKGVDYILTEDSISGRLFAKKDGVMLKPNKLMTWEEMKKEYPAKWVFVEIVEGNETNYTKGVVRAVVVDEHLAEGIGIVSRWGGIVYVTELQWNLLWVSLMELILLLLRRRYYMISLDKIDNE